NTFQFFPVLVTENQRGMAIVMDLGVLTATLGAVLALAQPNMRRTVGYLVVYDAGMILFGLAATTSAGLARAGVEGLNGVTGLLRLAPALALLPLIRRASERLLGPAEDAPAEESPILLGTTGLDRSATRYLEPEPRGMALLTGVLLALCLAIGLYPQPLLATI